MRIPTHCYGVAVPLLRYLPDVALWRTGGGPDFVGALRRQAHKLLQLVARANANVAELMRLSDYVPSIFYMEVCTEN